MSSTLILSATDVDTLVKEISPNQLMELMQDVFQTLSSSPMRPSSESEPSLSSLSSLQSTIHTPHRTSIETPRHTTLFMPSRLPSRGTAIKIVSVPKAGGGSDGLPATTVVMDEATGGVKAIVNTRNLTALRNAAGSLLATSMCMPRDDKARAGVSMGRNEMTLVCFGAGAQIAAHIRLFLAYYNDDANGDRQIARCVVVNRSDNARLRTLVHDLRQDHPNVEFSSYAFAWSPVATTSPVERGQKQGEASSDVEAAVRSADIIVCATSSETALFPSSWVASNSNSNNASSRCHINLIGSYKPSMREVDAELVGRAGVILVDSKAACAREAGELIGAPGVVVTGKTGEPEIVDARVVEVGAFTAGDYGGGGVTIFKSVGVSPQDVAIASLVVQMAEEKRIGTKVTFE